MIAAYILLAFLYALKYAINAVLSYTGTRIALFVLVFVETMAKFLLPVLHCTIPAPGAITGRPTLRIPAEQGWCLS